MAREVIKKGADVRSLRKPINDAFAAIPTHIRAEGAAASTTGDTLSFSVYGEDIFYIRLDAKTGTSPIKYAWTMMVQDRDTGVWTASPRAGLTTDDSYAIELNNASVGTGSKRYAARLNPQTGRVTFDQGGSGGGSVEITSNETVLLILGPWTDYKDCPDAPPAPPKLKTPCGDPADGECVPAYAFAVYQRCGYIWKRVGDSRTTSFGTWATEINGGTVTAFRRFYVPRWGGDVDPTTGLPDPDSDCMGVAVLGYCSQSTLSCTCPACISSPPEDACIAIRFKTVPRPCPPDPMNIGCGHPCQGTFVAMDLGNAWDKEYEIKLDPIDCSVSNSSDDGLFGFAWEYYDEMEPCDWGPDEIDPCNLCAHWGLFKARLAVPGNSGPDDANPNCESGGHVRFRFQARDVCDLICDCESGPLAPYDVVLCDECAWEVEGPGGGTGTGEEGGEEGEGEMGPPMHFVDPESIQLVCCTATEYIMGGTPGDLPEDYIEGGTPGSLPEDFIEG